MKPAIELLENRRLLSAATLAANGLSTNTVALGTIASGTTPTPVNSIGGVTIHEVAGVQFTTSVGTFFTIAPGTNLKANINWGDGSSSAGTLKNIPFVSVDELEFAVIGTHTYAKAGTYAIQTVVIKPSPTSTTPVQLIARINSTAIVAAKSAVNLNGTITGTYSLAPTAAIIGATTVFNGSGTAGDLGAVAAHGSITVPGPIVTGNATGTLTLTRITTSTSGAGSVTLSLNGPVSATAAGGVPSLLSYIITGGTGVDAGATGSGTIAVTLGPGNAFKFVIMSA